MSRSGLSANAQAHQASTIKDSAPVSTTECRTHPPDAPGVSHLIAFSASRSPRGKAFNSAAFTPALTGQQGDFGRNVLRSFGSAQADVAFQRQFHFKERVQLRFRGEFFNIFNHPNFGPPTNNVTSPLFGLSTQTLASSLGSGGANGGSTLSIRLAVRARSNIGTQASILSNLGILVGEWVASNLHRCAN